MNSVNSRLEEILTQYANTVADIESPTTPAPHREVDPRILRPPDQQRACRTPTIAPTA
jgi:hypothetical protein